MRVGDLEHVENILRTRAGPPRDSWASAQANQATEDATQGPTNRGRGRGRGSRGRRGRARGDTNGSERESTARPPSSHDEVS